MVENLKIGGNSVRVIMTFCFTILRKIPWNEKDKLFFFRKA